MFKRLVILVGIVAVSFSVSGNVFGQEMTMLWQDDFNDTAIDPAGLFQVVWFRFDSADGLVGSTVAQVDDELVVSAGVFSELVGVGLVETNGVPAIDPSDPVAAKAALLRDPPYGSPNAVITFQVNFVNFTESFFLLAARLNFTDTTDAMPVADPTEESGYGVAVTPALDNVVIGRYEGSLAAIDPTGWSLFGQGTFDFEPDVYYWCQYYLNGGDLKVKFWEGDLADGDTVPWLIEGTDPDPRVSGEWVTLASIGPPTAMGTIFKIDDFMVQGFGTSAVESNSGQVPETFALEQNYPNPFNPSTQIRYALAKPANTSLEVYNMAGQKVRTLVVGYLAAGNYVVSFDGKNDNGQTLGSGVYLYRLKSGNLVEQKKMLFMK